MKKDSIYLIWRDSKTGKGFPVGTLTRSDHYEFTYANELQDAKTHGFTPLIGMPSFTAKYSDDQLFPIFSCRLPSPKRKDIQRILDTLGLDTYDEFEILKRSGAQLPTDTLKFVSRVFTKGGQSL